MTPETTSQTAAKSVEALTMELAVTRAALEGCVKELHRAAFLDKDKDERHFNWTKGPGWKAISQAEKVLGV